MADSVDLYNTCLFIQEHLDSDLSLLALADMAGLSRFRFHRVFKAWSGETLHDFVTRLRMERAAFELSYPAPRARRSVKAIAFATGYKSLSSFSHAFSAYAGVSPRAYRARALAERRDGPRQSAGLEGFSVHLCELEEREIVVLQSSAPGYSARMAIPESIDTLLIDSLPALQARTTRARGPGMRPLHLSSLAIAGAEWDALIGEPRAAEKQPRFVRLTLRGGEYALVQGSGSLAQVYRLLGRALDPWLARSGRCPGSGRLFVSFEGGAPQRMHEVRRLKVLVPLEPQAERTRVAPVILRPGRTTRILESEAAHA